MSLVNLNIDQYTLHINEGRSLASSVTYADIAPMLFYMKALKQDMENVNNGVATGVPFTFTLSCADYTFQPQGSSDYVFGTRYGIEPAYVSSAYMPSFLVPSSLVGNYFGFYVPNACTITNISVSAGYIGSAGVVNVPVHFRKNNTTNYLVDNVDFSIINYKSSINLSVPCNKGDYIDGIISFGTGTTPAGFFVTLLFYCN